MQRFGHVSWSEVVVQWSNVVRWLLRSSNQTLMRFKRPELGDDGLSPTW